jgi:hypothetical protein
LHAAAFPSEQSALRDQATGGRKPLNRQSVGAPASMARKLKVPLRRRLARRHPLVEDPMTLIPQDSLDWLVAMLRDGRAYYRHAVVHTDDAEVRRAFEIAAQARSRLVAELQSANLCKTHPLPEEPVQDLSVVPLPHRYETLRKQFDGQHPDHQAEALVVRDQATLRLMESVFRSHPSIAARGLMKSHYLRMQESAAIVERMAKRTHAA